MNKKILLIVFFVGAGFFCFAANIYAANCGDTNSDGTTDAVCVCGDTVIGAADYTYQLTGNLTCTGHGLVVGANNITIDGENYTIDGDDGASDYGINNAGGWDDVSVIDLNITDFNRGIYFSSSTGAEGQVIQNVNISSCNDGIHFSLSPSNTLTGNTANSNSNYGIYLVSSPSNTLTGNTANSNFYYGIFIYASSSNTLTGNTANFNNNNGIYLESSSSNTLSNNIVKSNLYGLYISGSSSNVITDNTILNNRNDIFYFEVGNTYSGNQILNNITSKMFTFVEPTRTYSVGNTISFDVSMFDIEGTACSGCSYTITSSPSETITSSKNSNQITGSFVPTKTGTYSLMFTVTDTESSPNITKRNLLFIVGDTQAKTTKYYLRGVAPTHGQPSGTDAMSMSLTAPTATEIWTCGGWIQNSPDEIPNYPLSNLSDINIYSWYKQSGAEAYIGAQRYLVYNNEVDYNSSVASVADYTESTKSFDLSALGGDWIMDYSRSWHWIALKQKGTDPYWTTFPSGHTASEASYANFIYSYPITPAIKSISNDDINVLSATAPTTDTSNATIVLDYPLSGSASANIVIGDPDNSHAFRRPFSGYTTTISYDGTVTLQATGITSSAATINSVPMDITPNAGTIDVGIATWNTSGTYSKEWTETGTGVSTATHVVGNLKANTYYILSVDDTIIGSYLSNADGEISFNYTGGYSSHTFNVDEDATAPSNVSISSINIDSSSQFTITANTATDSGTGLHATPYWFTEVSGNSGGSSSTEWQASSIFVDSGLSLCTQYSYKVKVRDVAGNESDYSPVVSKSTGSCPGGGLSAVAYNPPAAPQGGFSVVVNNSAKTTDNKSVNLLLSAGTDIKNMAISNFSDFSNAVQEPYQATKTWDLCYQKSSCSNGEYTVYAKFYTQYGQVSEIVSDTINLTGQANKTNTNNTNQIQSLTSAETAIKIAELKQRLILLITQLIQMLSEQVSQMKKQ